MFIHFLYKDKDMIEEKTMKAGQAAALIGVSQPTLMRWVKEGRAPAPVVRYGKVVRFDVAAVEALLQRMRGGVAA